MKCIVAPWKDSKKDFFQALPSDKIIREYSWFWIMELEWSDIQELAKNFDIRIEHKNDASSSVIWEDHIKIYLSKKFAGFIVS